MHFFTTPTTPLSPRARRRRSTRLCPTTRAAPRHCSNRRYSLARTRFRTTATAARDAAKACTGRTLRGIRHHRTNGIRFSLNHGHAIAAVRAWVIDAKGRIQKDGKCAGASQEAAVRATKAAMKAKRVLLYSYASAGRCEQAAVIPPVTVVAAAPSITTCLTSWVFLCLYNATTHVFGGCGFIADGSKEIRV